jgi:sec-independent protein translocase protein TatA
VGNLGATELLIIAGVIILLFGARKMPDMARSLGRSMRILKAETKGMRSDDEQDVEPAQPAKPQQQLPQAQAPQAAPSVDQTQTQANKNAG